jgi:hypothetical protein
MPRSPRFEVLKLCRLRVYEEPGRDGEGRPPRGLDEAGNSERPPNPNRTAEDTRRKFGESGELTGAPSQDNTAARR